MFKPFKVIVPASSANIGPGYDVLGMALNIYNMFECKHSNKNILILDDKDKNQININNNLFIKSYQKGMQYKKQKILPLEVTISLNVPMSRGLGSSATAIVGGLMAAKEILKQASRTELTLEEVYTLACKIEKHPDNIGATLFGGLVLNIDNKPLQIPFKAPLQIACLIPDIQLSTEETRKKIPKQISIKDLTYQTSHIGALTYLLTLKKWKASDFTIFKQALNEKIHQNIRSTYITGMKETFKHWSSLGAAGYYLSGSGSTLVSFWTKNTSVKNLDLNKIMRNKKIKTNVIFPKICTKGAHLKNV